VQSAVQKKRLRESLSERELALLLFGAELAEKGREVKRFKTDSASATGENDLDG
jgi:hypothetical protein